MMTDCFYRFCGMFFLTPRMFSTDASCFTMISFNSQSTDPPDSRHKLNIVKDN